MPNRCVAGYCSCDGTEEGVHFFRWPSNVTTARKWTSFVRMTRRDFDSPSKWSTLCSHHFTDSDYANLTAFRLGGNKLLKLKPEAFPTVLPQKTSAATTQDMVDLADKRMHTRRKLLGSRVCSLNFETKIYMP